MGRRRLKAGSGKRKAEGSQRDRFFCGLAFTLPPSAFCLPLSCPLPPRGMPRCRGRRPAGAAHAVKESFARYVTKQRLRPWHLAFCVLLVGWVPSLLLAYYSYRVLGRTLENKIMADAQSLVGQPLPAHRKRDSSAPARPWITTAPCRCTANLLLPPPALPAAIDLPRPPPLPVAAAAPAANGGAATAHARGPRMPRPRHAPAVPHRARHPGCVVAGAQPRRNGWLNVLLPCSKSGASTACSWSMPPAAHGRLPAAVRARRTGTRQLQPPRRGAPPQRTRRGRRETRTLHFRGDSRVYSAPGRRATGGQPWSWPCASKADSADLLGYLGADILIERLGTAPARRRTPQFGREHPLSRSSTTTGQTALHPRPGAQPAQHSRAWIPGLLRVYRHDQEGIA